MYIYIYIRVVNDSGIQNRNQSLIWWNRNWNRSHMMLESESELESSYLGNTGIGIRMGITSYWKQNWNRDHGFW